MTSKLKAIAEAAARAGKAGAEEAREVAKVVAKAGSAADAIGIMREAIPADAAAIAISLAPDVCNTPVGPSVVPVPYPAIGLASDAVGYSTTVKANGKQIKLISSLFMRTIGDEAGVALGVKSGTVMGPVRPMMGAVTVLVEGRAVIRHGDPCELNGGNCPGEYLFIKSIMTYPSPDPEDAVKRTAREAFNARARDASDTLRDIEAAEARIKDYAKDPSLMADDAREGAAKLGQLPADAITYAANVDRGLGKVMNDPYAAIEALVVWTGDQFGSIWELGASIYAQEGLAGLAGFGAGIALEWVAGDATDKAVVAAAGAVGGPVAAAVAKVAVEALDVLELAADALHDYGEPTQDLAVVAGGTGGVRISRQ